MKSPKNWLKQLIIYSVVSLSGMLISHFIPTKLFPYWVIASLIIGHIINRKNYIKMADYKKKPRITSSKKQCKCDETGEQIEKFDKILFDPVNKKVYCQDSSAYEQHIIKLESLHNH